MSTFTTRTTLTGTVGMVSSTHWLASQAAMRMLELGGNAFDAAVAGGTYLFCLPGSPGACRDGWDEILKPQLDIRHRPCNFAELIPRLREHE